MEWIDLWSFIISCLSIIVTSILTIYLIVQNVKLNNKQIENQKELQLKQEELNKRQLKIEERPYIEKVYKAIFDIYSYTESIESMLRVINGQNDFKNVVENIKSFTKSFNYLLDDKDYNLVIGEYYVSDNVSPTIKKIRDIMSDIIDVLMFFYVGDDLTQNYKEEKIVKEKLEYLTKLCKEMDDTKSFINTMLEAQIKKSF